MGTYITHKIYVIHKHTSYHKDGSFLSSWSLMLRLHNFSMHYKVQQTISSEVELDVSRCY